MGPSDRPTIDLEKQKFSMTAPKWFALAAVLGAAGIAYAQLATENYVDEKHENVVAKIDALTTAQKNNAAAVKKLTEGEERQKKEMKLVVRLVAAQYMDHADAEEEKPRRRRASRPARSAKAQRVAEALKLDPDDPLAGLELTEALEE